MRHWHRIILSVLAAWVVPADATAQPKQPADVQVWAIRATTKNSEISPELRGLADALKKQFKYTGFKLEKRADGRVAVGEAYTVELLEGYKAAVTPKERTGERMQLQVVVSKREGNRDKPVVNTTYTVGAGSFLPIGCGSLSGGDYLIVAVRAR